MSLRRLLEIIGKFRGTEPFLLALNLTIRCGPADLATESLKVSLGLSPLFLSDGGKAMFRDRSSKNSGACLVASIQTYLLN